MSLKDILAASTPGPWAVCLTDDTVVIGPDRLEVAAIDGDYNRPETWPIMEANAALIALAPDMAAALIEAEKALERLACLGNGDRPGNSDGNVIAQAALATIRKVTGRFSGDFREVSE